MKQKTIEQALVRLKYFLEREDWDGAVAVVEALRPVRIDPTVRSAPFVTTLVDTTGLFAYLHRRQANPGHIRIFPASRQRRV